MAEREQRLCIKLNEVAEKVAATGTIYKEQSKETYGQARRVGCDG